MLTYPTVARPSRRTLAFALPLVLLIAACGSAAAPNPTPAPATPQPTPTDVPGIGLEPGGGGAGNGGNTGGGTDPGKPVGGGGGGIVFPLPIPPNPNDNPFLGEPTVVVPTPGRLNPHPVSVGFFRAAVSDDGVVVELRWYSGIEDCYATDSVRVERDDTAKTIHLTVIEGTNAGDMACIDIAVLKATVVDVGELAPGTWTISAEGEAEPFELEVG